MSLQVALLAALTLLIGWLMMFAGVSKSVLEWRRNRRMCPACGREIVARTCPCSSA